MMTDERAEIPAAGFTLLRKLAANNVADWVRDNAGELDTKLRAPFLRFVEAVSARLADEGLNLAGGADTVFRMRRDLRFTRDRRPLHEHVEAVFSRDRGRVGCRGALHVRLDTGGGFLAAGSFLQPATAVHALREAMVGRKRSFLRIASDLDRAGCPLESDESLTLPPRGFSDVTNERLGAFLRMKQPLARRALTRAEWRSGDAVEATVEFARSTRRWIMFQREALSGVPDVVARPPRSKDRG
jgi:uncharacterized protein (TIGR02453 family)